jgi:hypothetical protein
VACCMHKHARPGSPQLTTLVGCAVVTTSRARPPPVEQLPCVPARFATAGADVASRPTHISLRLGNASVRNVPQIGSR